MEARDISDARKWWELNRDRVIASLPLTVDGVTYSHWFPPSFEAWLYGPDLSPELSEAYIFNRIRKLQKGLGLVQSVSEGHEYCQALLRVIQTFLSMPPHSDPNLADLFDLLGQLEPDDKHFFWGWLGDNAPNIKRWLMAKGGSYRRAA